MLRISPGEVRQGAQRSDSRLLRSRAGSGGPARPTAIKSWQMRSGKEEEEEGRKRRRRAG